MGEIRLTCPECGAEYRIAEGAIPPGGRSVECSSCGTVWHQAGLARSDDTEPHRSDDRAVPLNRPLPDSVLSVLREEAELARRQRDTAAHGASEGPGTVLPLQPPDPAEPDPSEPGPPAEDWPATTITTPLTDGIAPRGLPAEAPPAGPAPSRHINATPARPTADAPPHQVMEATITRSTPHRASPILGDDQAAITVEPVHHPASRYRRGFGLALGIAAMLLLLYAAAPSLAEKGGPGAALMELRLAVDDGRMWLGDRVDVLLGRAADPARQ